MSANVLVAGIGNIFLSDDGFGVEVANRLAAEPMPAGAKVADFGIRGVHLAYELLEGYDGVVLVDAVPMGEEPGTVAIIKPGAPDAPGDGDSPPLLDAHSMSPQVVLHTLCRLGGTIDNVYVVGCQPASLEAGIGLSPQVADAIDGAVDLCRQLVADIAQAPPERKVHRPEGTPQREEK